MASTASPGTGWPTPARSSPSLGYDGVGLTLDQPHLDPFARPPRPGRARPPLPRRRTAWPRSSRRDRATSSTRGASTSRPWSATRAASGASTCCAARCGSPPSSAPRRCRAGRARHPPGRATTAVAPGRRRPRADARRRCRACGVTVCVEPEPGMFLGHPRRRARAARAARPPRAPPGDPRPGPPASATSRARLRTPAPRRRAAGQRAGRRHGPRRARAPRARHRASSTSTRPGRAGRAPATRAWPASSCRVTPTPPRPWPPRPWRPSRPRSTGSRAPSTPQEEPGDHRQPARRARRSCALPSPMPPGRRSTTCWPECRPTPRPSVASSPPRRGARLAASSPTGTPGSRTPSGSSWSLRAASGLGAGRAPRRAGASSTATATRTRSGRCCWRCPAPTTRTSTGSALLLDALRTNDVRLVAAAMGPHARRLSPHDWRHGVLKCLFVGVPLADVADLADARRRRPRRDGAALRRRAPGGRSLRAGRRHARARPRPDRPPDHRPGGLTCASSTRTST